MVRWMCSVKVKDRVPSKELRERLGIDDIILVLQQNRLRWCGHVRKKKTPIGWRNVWNMRLRAPDQEVDQRGHGKRLSKKIAKHVIWTRRMLWATINSNISPTRPYNIVNFGPLTAENCWRVWGIPANFNGFRFLATLLHGTLAVGVSQSLRRWTESATYIRQGGHHVGHWPTF